MTFAKRSGMRAVGLAIAGLVWGLLAGSSPAVAATVAVESRISSKTCRIGQELVWTIEVKWPGAASAFRIDRLELPRFPGFQVRHRVARDSIVADGATKSFRRQVDVTLAAAEPGSFTIGEASVSVTDDQGKAQDLASKSVTVQVDPSPVRAILTGLGGILGLVVLSLGLRSMRRRPRTDDSAGHLETERQEFDRVMRLQNHRDFYGRLLDVLRTGFCRRLNAEIPADRQQFIQRLKELGVRDAVVHLAGQVWTELDEGRFNPESPSGKDRDRIIFQIQDLFKELEGRKQGG